MAETCVEHFLTNLKKWSVFFPEYEDLLRNLDCPNYYFSRTGAHGDLNLQRNVEGKPEFVHSEKDVAKEAADWFARLSLKDIKVIYVYGIGLGYYYEAAKAWLAEDPSRYLVFLEDDMEILHRFLETDTASVLLAAKQVRIFPMTWPILMDDKGVDYLCTALLFDPYVLSGSEFYQKTKSQKESELKNSFSFLCHMKKIRAKEYLQSGGHFFHNFYINLLELPNSYLGSKLAGKFSGIPAIICGAGPSLSKNIDVLRGLKDKALIFAGGTAMNALNSLGVQAHFGITIDPNETQVGRLLANTAYQTPFFYRNRVHPECLKLIQGEHLYINGAGGYRLPTRFEEELGVADGKEALDEGYNVTNFSVAIAHMMGCNPIIVVGVDLAYSDNSSYAPGLKSHGLHCYAENLQTKFPDDELLQTLDVFGMPTYTLWKWMSESKWYTDFAKANPNVNLVNSTEGGIGFPEVVNLPLSLSAGIHLKKSYDLEGLIHSEIQNVAVPDTLTSQKILALYEDFEKSLMASEDLVGSISEKYGELARGILFNQISIEKYDVSEINALLAKLDAEIAKKYLLDDFAGQFRWLLSRKMRFLKMHEEVDEEGSLMADAKFEEDCYAFLAKVCKNNHAMIHKAISIHTTQPLTFLSNADHHVREVAGSREEKEIANQMSVSRYPGGKIKSEQNDVGGLLEGPSTFYSEEGKILSRTYYHKGLKEGEAKYYYISGELSAIKRFKKGELDGKQEYYYSTGTLKSELNYSEGKLNGKVLLYYPNGQIKREMNFVQNSREGEEKMWSEMGIPIIEVKYKDDSPVGEAIWRHEDGNNRLKVNYPKGFNAKKALQNTFEMPQELAARNQYLDHLVELTGGFANRIQRLFMQADTLMPLIGHMEANKVLKIREEINSLKDEYDKLMEIYNLSQPSKAENAFGQVPWRTLNFQRKLEQQLRKIIEKLSTETETLQELVKNASKVLKGMKDQNKNEPT